MSAFSLKPAGFSLVELMVVLGLVSLIGAVVFPGVLRLYDSAQRRVEEQEIVSRINGLGLEAWHRREAISLRASTLELPSGWSLQVPVPVAYRANGVCLGGTIQLVHAGSLRRTLKLAPPYCQVSDEG